MTQESQAPDQNTPKEELEATASNAEGDAGEREAAFTELAARLAEELGLNEVGAKLRGTSGAAKPEDKSSGTSSARR